MLRSGFCILSDLTDSDLYDLNECPYDQGGYFIINGSEKVLIAQERMAGNHVYVFAKAQPSPINFLAEIRSAPEKGGKTVSTFQVKMFHRSQEKSVSRVLDLHVYNLLTIFQSGNVIKATIPYIRTDIPIWVVFRALGVISDRDILEHICYDMQDAQMLEMLKPCIDDGFVIQDRDVSISSTGYFPLTYMTRLPSISLVIVEQLLVYRESVDCVMPKKFFKRKCCLTFPWRKATSQGKLTSLATWSIDYYLRP